MTRLFLILIGLSVLTISTGGQAADPLLARVKQERGAYLKRCSNWAIAFGALIER